jgi:Domain of unknown function (DUF4920)
MTTRILLFVAAAALLASCSSPAGEGQGGSADTTARTPAAPNASYYGDTISAEGSMDMGRFATALAGKDSLDGKVDCEIITSCQKKGCWMTVKMPNGEPMRVGFKDYAFFVPTTGLEGKRAVIQGRAMREITDVAMLKHYAEDEGRSPDEIAKITEPDTSWSFTADGVIIRD